MKSRPSVWLLLALAAPLAISATCWAQTGTTGTTTASPDTVSTTPPPASAPAEAPPAAAPPTAPPASSTPTSVQPTTPPPPPAQAQAETAPRRSGGPFDKGAMHGSFTAGWGRSFGQDYLMVGAGLGRFIRKGMEVGVWYEAWFGSDPSVSKLTPEVRLVLAKAQRLMIPYVGAFYRRTFIGSDIDDLNSIGARAGIYKGGGRTYLGFGGVWEKYLDCDESTYEDCTTFYPEGSVGVSF